MGGKIELGDIAEDTITGLTGVAVAEAKFLHGCRRIALQSRELKDGKPIDAIYFDEPQLKLVSKRAAPSTSHTGGPQPAPTRHVDHTR